jgi:hypothetical protein
MNKQILLAALLLLAPALPARAQTYAPTAGWPFLYEEFQPGAIFFANDATPGEQLLNIHLLNVSLWRREGDDLLMADPRGISRIVIAADTFIYLNGQLARLIRAAGEAQLVLLVKGNYNALISASSGAYGMSAQSSAATNMTGISHINYTQMKIEEADNRPLPLIRQHYFIFGDKIVAASRRELEKALPPAGVPKLRAFVKAHKIKWTDPQSLILLLDFFR